VSPQAKLQPDPVEQLQKILEELPRGYGFLAAYVRELELHRDEDDVFRRLAFGNAIGGAFGSFIVNVFSELYEPLEDERKLEIRQWWHGKVRGEASQFDDLRTRLFKIA
jgi:hypothetical protein